MQEPRAQKNSTPFHETASERFKGRGSESLEEADLLKLSAGKGVPIEPNKPLCTSGDLCY